MRTKRFLLAIIFLLLTSVTTTSFGDNSITAGSNDSMFFIKGYTHHVLLDWKNVRGASKYEVRYSISPDMLNAVVETSSMTRYEVSGLKSATVYYFQGRVLNDSKWTDWSEIKKCKTALFSTTIGTYNILSAKYDHVFPDNPWKDRKEAMASIILQSDNNPDILGIQEGMVKSQVQSLASLLKGKYEVHISERDISPRAIFWKRERYSLVTFDDNIEVMDSISGSATTRYVTYARLKERKTDKEILVFNLHAPSSYSGNKEKERNLLAGIISKKAKEFSKAANNAPVIILGDFNSYPKSSNEIPTASMILTSNGFTDTFVAASDKRNAYYGTHDRITLGIATSGQNEVNWSKRIDYIFTYPKDRVTVSDYQIIINFADDSGAVMKQPIPSDHRPVKTTIHLYY